MVAKIKLYGGHMLLSSMTVSIVLDDDICVGVCPSSTNYLSELASIFVKA